jgi:molecular chaperone GrpE
MNHKTSSSDGPAPHEHAPNEQGPGDALNERTNEATRDSESAEQRADGGSDVERLRDELDAARDQILRAQADLENYRKRMRREMDDERRYASLPLLRDLLPVLDNMGRAAKAAETAADTSALLEGFKMVEQQLQGVLRQYQCTPIEPANEPFDPNLHQAISAVPSADHAPNTVVQVVQTGYTLHDRVVRPAQVIVSTATN